MDDKQTRIDQFEELRKRYGVSQERFSLIRRTIAKNADEIGLEKLLYLSKELKLDALQGQIHLVGRFDSEKNQWVWDVQVGIDGLRSLAEDTGQYAGQDLPIFYWSSDSEPDKVVSGPVFPDGAIVQACSVTVHRRMSVTGEPVSYGYTAYLRDYLQRKRDGKITFMWTKVGVMLPKCAEAGALRKGFPRQLGGLYVPEEMEFLKDQQPETQPGPAAAEEQVDKSAKEEPAKMPPATGETRAEEVSAQKTASAPARPPKALVKKQPTPATPESPKQPPPETATTEAVAVPSAEGQSPAGEPPTVKSMGQEIISVLRDHYKDKAGEVVKNYIVSASGSKNFVSVPAATRDEMVKLLYLRIVDARAAGSDPASALISMIENKEKANE